MNYRPEIDGLRAISVMAVVFFHAGYSAFFGGFLGVDVFFVISGFLITNIILHDIEAGKFSIATFYERRARRILPAAFVVFTASAICAWFTLLPTAFADFSKSLIAATLFYSNWFFLFDASYFSAPAALKPLLHTWTLSIEEQFYLVFPLLLVGLATYWRRLSVLIALCLASILYARHVSSASGFDALFYNSFCRAFEPLIGGITCLISRRSDPGPVTSVILRVAGLAMIGLSFLYVGASGYRQLLLPCLGASAFLLASPVKHDPAYIVMTSPPFRVVGLMSYSIYLWHWPVFVFGSLWLGALNGMQTAGCIALTLLLSSLTFVAVEQPFRRKVLLKTRARVFSLASASAATILVFAGTIISLNGVGQRVPDEVNKIQAASNWDPDLYKCFDPPGGIDTLVDRAQKDNICAIGDQQRDSIDFVVWGDSHAFAASSAFAEMAKSKGLKGLVSMTPGCPSLSNTANGDLGREQKCSALFEAVAKVIELHDIRTIFFISRWSLYTEGEIKNPEADRLRFANDWDARANRKEVFSTSLNETLKRFRGRQIVIVKEPPTQRIYVTDTMAQNAFMGLQPSRLQSRWTTLSEHLARNHFVNSTFETKGNDVTIIDPTAILCHGNICLPSRDGLPLYWDDDHLNHRGASLVLKPLISAIFHEMSVSHSASADEGLKD